MQDVQMPYEVCFEWRYIIMLFNRLHGYSQEILKLFTPIFDCVVTSPPYFKNKKYEDYKNYDHYLTDMREVFTEVFRTLKTGGIVFLNINSHAKKPLLFYDWITLMLDIGFDYRFEIIWHRRNSTHYRSNKRLVDLKEFIFVFSKGDYKIYPTQYMIPSNDTYNRYVEKPLTNIWNIPVLKTNQFMKTKSNTATFPLEIPLRCLSIIPYEYKVILDPFDGVGTTGEACKLLNKGYIGIDKENKEGIKL